MQNAVGKLLAALAILIVVLLVILHFQNSSSPKPLQEISVASTNRSISSQISFHPHNAAPMAMATNDEVEADEPLEPMIPRDRLEQCLQKDGRGVTNLLAAFHLSRDTNYLNEAVANFPDDPRVQFTVLARNAFPDDRRKWLDAFKASAPSNSLANYLSAENYFRNGNTNAAIDELLAADNKIELDSYAVDSQRNQESLAQCSGSSPIEAHTFSLLGFSEEDLPLLATYKRLAQQMNDLKKQFAATDDKDSMENLAAVQLDMADQIGSGDSGKYLINQLVAVAIESISLSQLDQNTSYDFLDGKTPAQVQQELKDQKKQWSQLSKNFNTLYSQFTEQELLDYSERTKTDGELEAMKWIVQQHQQDNPQ